MLEITVFFSALDCEKVNYRDGYLFLGGTSSREFLSGIVQQGLFTIQFEMYAVLHPKLKACFGIAF